MYRVCPELTIRIPVPGNISLVCAVHYELIQNINLVRVIQGAVHHYARKFVNAQTFLKKFSPYICRERKYIYLYFQYL